MSTSINVTLLEDSDTWPVNLECSTTVAGVVADTRRAEVISKIEAIITSVVEGLTNTKTITIPIKSRPQARSDRPSGLQDQEAPLNKIPSACFPSKSSNGAWRFSACAAACDACFVLLITYSAVGIRILELIHEALVNNTVTTKR